MFNSILRHNKQIHLYAKIYCSVPKKVITFYHKTISIVWNYASIYGINDGCINPPLLSNNFILLSTIFMSQKHWNLTANQLVSLAFCDFLSKWILMIKHLTAMMGLWVNIHTINLPSKSIPPICFCKSKSVIRETLLLNLSMCKDTLKRWTLKKKIWSLEALVFRTWRSLVHKNVKNAFLEIEVPCPLKTIDSQSLLQL